MYAAHYNQLAAAEMLLKAGTDPNATTYSPSGRCEYQINTHNVSPLHYAARYSSARLIQLLLDNGAVTFIQSTGELGPEYALDRLQRYAGAGVTEERNPHIAESEVAALAKLLAPPSEKAKHALATELVDRARAEYAKGNAQKAYQHLRLALLARPDQPGAIADLPLIALRAGYIGPAISAADRAVKTLTSPAALAGAWFNKGLICEHPAARTAITVDRARCEWNTVEPFVNAWRTQASPARADKLRAIIRDSKASCSRANAARYYRITVDRLFESIRVYVLHSANETIDAWQIRWPPRAANGGFGPTPTVTDSAQTKVVEKLSLGRDVVTVLEARVRDPNDRQKVRLVIEDQECAAVF
jgi:hypothetical protein